MSDTRVAVLGGGIAGCLTACMLADRGVEVTIVEQRTSLVDGASRWNDGKIHLGYTFSGTASRATAELLQAGAARFVPILERVLGTRIPAEWFGQPTIYIVDPESLFDVSTLWRRALAVTGMLAAAVPEERGLELYGGPEPDIQRLDPDAAAEETGQRRIAAAWRTPERHVSAREIAEHLRRAVSQRPITVVHRRVESVAAHHDSWRVGFDGADHLAAQIVVNCLWEERPRIDRQVAPESAAGAPVSIRYKRALFGTRAGLERLTPSTRILGPFGDVATCGNGDAYLSWYPAGLAAHSEDGSPPPVPRVDEAQITTAILNGLRLTPEVLGTDGARWTLGGGFVVAYGRGDVDRRRTLLHRRDRPGARELRAGYLSVDTGKYTLGPLLAERAAAMVNRLIREGRSRLAAG
jgi:hypothetical protein